MKNQKKIFYIAIALTFYFLFSDFITPFDPILSLDKENLSALPPFSKAYKLELKNNQWIIAFDYKIENGILHYKQKFSKGEINLELVHEIKTLFFLFGTDNLGKDILSRTIFGGKISLAIGILSSLIAFLIGILMGTLSGYFGGITDKILMRITDIFLAFPKLFLILTISAFIKSQNILTLIIILSLLNWMSIARLVRAEFLKIKQMDFILAVESIGFPALRVAIKHILPNAISPALISIPLIISDVILTESILSFLGFGIQPPTPTWGNMISEAEKYLFTTWWLPIFPGTLISITVLSMNWISETSK